MRLSTHLLASLTLAASSTSAADDLPSREEMWRIIQQQQKQIEQLMQQQQTSEEKIEDTVSMVEATADAVEQRPVATESKVHIGSYGELHYNNLKNKTTGKAGNEIDLHRFVLLFGYDFTDRTRFFSEFELEHAIAGDGEAGAAEMEQAYVEHDFSDAVSALAGLFLIPVGIINETHEPTTFYGVERNAVENRIIPTTWREGGVHVKGRFAQGWSWDAALSSGFFTSAENDYLPRKGRQKVSEAVADNLAATGRLKWTGLPGVELAASLQYQDDITQGTDPLAGSATLAEAHAVFERGAFGLRALYAQWNMAGDGPAAIGADRQFGWYIEPAWRFSSSLGVFARYLEWDNAAGDDIDSKTSEVMLGANYWLNEHVVFKVDMQRQSAGGDGKELNGFNLGMGYSF